MDEVYHQNHDLGSQFYPLYFYVHTIKRNKTMFLWRQGPATR